MESTRPTVPPAFPCPLLSNDPLPVRLPRCWFVSSLCGGLVANDVHYWPFETFNADAIVNQPSPDSFTLRKRSVRGETIAGLRATRVGTALQIAIEIRGQNHPITGAEITTMAAVTATLHAIGLTGIASRLNNVDNIQTEPLAAGVATPAEHCQARITRLLQLHPLWADFILILPASIVLNLPRDVCAAAHSLFPAAGLFHLSRGILECAHPYPTCAGIF